MKIGIHLNQLDQRGTAVVTYDYASAIRKYLGYDVHVISSRPKSVLSPDRFNKFGITLYDNVSELESIVDKEKIDVLHMLKAGNDDKICPTNTKTAIHCIFEMREQHGNVYAGVSQWLAEDYFKMPLWVPHIVDVPKVPENLRDELSIPKNAFVVGRHGGFDQFDLPFVHSAIKKVLDIRSDLWFLFLNTKRFIDHPRVIFLPFAPDPDYKSKFINTCDTMLHARSDGETFGLAVAEFSSLNKPVITYDGPHWWYMRAHIKMLDDRAILYKNEEELINYLLMIDNAYVSDIDWDRYSIPFSPKNVIQRFDSVFIK